MRLSSKDSFGSSIHHDVANKPYRMYVIHKKQKNILCEKNSEFFGLHFAVSSVKEHCSIIC